MRNLILIVCIVGFISSCNSSKEKTSVEAAKTDKDTIQEPIKIKCNSLDSLGKFFTKTTDEFSGRTYYYHKLWGDKWPSKSLLYCYVSGDGIVGVRSAYSSSDWIFHKSVSILIGKEKLQLKEIIKNMTEVMGGGDILEMNVYDDGDPVLKAIAQAPDTTEIKIRFHGSEYYDDIKFTVKNREALRQCYELSECLKNQ